mgnify:CR=1 FL=1
MLNYIGILKSGIFSWSTENFGFIDSLKIMLRGMLSIFVVTGVLILLVIILNKYSKKKKENDKQ